MPTKSTRQVRAIMIAAVLGAIAAGAIGYGTSRTRLAAVALVESLPHFSGALHGPADRKTPNGLAAAAHWWSVDNGDDEGFVRYCTGRARDQLVLDTDAGPMRIAWTSAEPDDVGLVSDDRTDEHGRRFMFDLGSHDGEILDTVPPGTCTSDDARYAYTMIPQGAHVEVIGCAADGEIRACDGAIGGVLAVPDLATYVAHLRSIAMRRFYVGIAIALSLLAAGVVIWLRRSR